MQRRSFMSFTTSLITFGSFRKAVAQPTSSPIPALRTLPTIVTDMIEAKNAAAGNVYVVHNYGSTLGLTPQDIAKFEISYVRLASAANGFLEKLGFLVENNAPIDENDINSRAATLMDQAKALDDSVAAISRNQQRAGAAGGERGLDFLKLLQSVVPLLSPIIGAITGVTKAVKDSRDQAAAERKAFADQVRKTYWPDVKTAAGTPPAPSKSS